MKRLQNKTYSLTVEGQCEKLYFEHLENLINKCPDRKYNCVFKPEIAIKKSPLKVAKQSVGKSVQHYHIQDIEDGNDLYQVTKFHELIREIDEANKIVDYKLGYSNFSFELWIVLHKKNLITQVQDRSKYISHINQAYGTKYQYIDEYKKEANFLSLLDDICLNDVKNAIKRAKKIRFSNENSTSTVKNQKKITFKKYSYFRENPDLDIQYVVEEIINDCLGK